MCRRVASSTREVTAGGRHAAVSARPSGGDPELPAWVLAAALQLPRWRHRQSRYRWTRTYHRVRGSVRNRPPERSQPRTHRNECHPVVPTSRQRASVCARALWTWSRDCGLALPRSADERCHRNITLRSQQPQPLQKGCGQRESNSVLPYSLYSRRYSDPDGSSAYWALDRSGQCRCTTSPGPGCANPSPIRTLDWSYSGP